MKLRNKKTGEIVVCGEGIIEFKAFGCKNLAEFLESGWEDYAPAAPLIKDEEIRKAVRAWAEATDRNKDALIKYNGDGLYENGFVSINFAYYHNDKFKAGDYTVAELCGEEE